MLPTINIGKSGLTDSMIEEIKRQLQRHKTVRVKLLPAVGEERHAIVDSLAAKVGARVQSKVGFVVVLEERKA
ncbi:YhbY family RNA-binding protein [Candidatus Woesearchaeota archaeon]|nr:YhbY family RNA-binding protein [Candidatus Woesearchaeota archaeon]